MKMPFEILKFVFYLTWINGKVKLHRFQVWFDKDIFAGIDDDECLEDADVEAAISAIKKKGGKIMEKKPEPKVGVAKANGDAESGYTSDDSESEPKRAKKAKKADGEDSDSSDSGSDYDMNQMQSLRTTTKGTNIFIQLLKPTVGSNANNCL